MYLERILKLKPLPFWIMVILVAACALTSWGIHKEPIGSPIWQVAVFSFALSLFLFVPLAVSSVFLTKKLKPSEILPIP